MITKVTDRALALQVALVALVAGRVAQVRENRDAGVVSIEYLVLGAAIIVIIGVLATKTEVGDTLANAFKALFTKASGS